MARDLASVGEDGWIASIRRRADRDRGRVWPVGIGDDAAVLRPRAGRDVVVTTDALVEDVHFRRSTTDAASLGHKTLAASLSDLAAMGARPLGCVLAAAVPADTGMRRLEELLGGLLQLARRVSCPLVGGDAVRSDRFTLSLTALGEVERGRALLRSGARVGDRVLVTGSLGGAALGLALLESGREGSAGAGPFVKRQRRPSPALSVGERLARSGIATAAMDLSDGLATDLARLALASEIGATIDLGRLPLPRGARAIARSLGLDATRLAVAGGEDYELLFCARKDAPDAAQLTRRLGRRVTEIGRIVRGHGVTFTRGDRPVDVSAADLAAFAHFKHVSA